MPVKSQLGSQRAVRPVLSALFDQAEGRLFLRLRGCGAQCWKLRALDLASQFPISSWKPGPHPALSFQGLVSKGKGLTVPLPSDFRGACLRSLP
jgi:hypothetical protein